MRWPLLLLVVVLALRAGAGAAFLPAAASRAPAMPRAAAPPPASLSAAYQQPQLAEIEGQLRERHDNAAMNALFRPCAREVAPTACGGAESLPMDLPSGALLRVGPNPRPGAAREAFLDGDGMVHCVVISPPRDPDDDDNDGSGGERRATYSRYWVRGRGFAMELEAGRQLFRGTLVAPRGWALAQSLLGNAVRGRGMVQKDTANTAIRTLGGQVLALMEQARPSVLSVYQSGAVQTTAAATDLGGAIPVSDPITGGQLSAHAREDAATGEVISVSYASSLPPFARCDVFGPDGALRHSVPLDLPKPVMVHDVAITASFTLVLDMPLTIRVGRILADRFPVEYEPEAGARIGVLPRWGGPEDLVWIPVEPGVVLHTTNAYERVDERGHRQVVLTAGRSQPRGPDSYLSEYTATMLYQWVLDLDEARCVSEGYLSTLPIELPAIHPKLHGSPRARTCVALALKSAGGPLEDFSGPQEGVLFDGIVKLDLHTGETLEHFRLPAGEFPVSEPTIVPKAAAPRNQGSGAAGTAAGLDAVDELDAYVLLLTSTAGPGGQRLEDGSKLLVLDAGQIAAGPVAALNLPAGVPYGVHSGFVPWEQLAADPEGTVARELGVIEEAFPMQ